MAWFGRVSKRGGASALIIATSAGLVISQQVGSTSHAVAAVATTTTMGPISPATAGASVQLTATVTPTPLGAVKTGVTFFDNGVAISPMRSSKTGKYATTINNIAVGAHSFSANFSGDASHGPSNSAPVPFTAGAAGVGVATMSFSSSPASPVTGGTPMQFSVTMIGSAGAPANPTGSVTFRNGTTVMSAGRKLTNGAVTLPWPAGLPVGTNSLSAAYSGDANYAPVNGTLSVVVTPSANDKFVSHLYTDMIGTPDLSGQAFWVSKLAAGMSRPTVTFAFTQTMAYDNAVVSQLYTNVMGRGADPGGANFWAGRMRAGQTPEQIAASMVASDERFASPSFGNGDLTTFIQATYRALLGRDADTPGLQWWHDYLAAGHPRWQLTLGFVSGTEWAHVTVTNMYAKFHLGVPAGSAWDYWAGQILAGMHDDQLAAQLTASQQYYDWAQTH